MCYQVWKNNETGKLYDFMHEATCMTTAYEGAKLIVYKDSSGVMVKDQKEFYEQHSPASGADCRETS